VTQKERRTRLLGYLPFASFAVAVLVAAVAGPSLRALARQAMDPTSSSSGDIKVTHIIFNHTWTSRMGGVSSKDALSIRVERDTPQFHGPFAGTDVRPANEAGAGEWIVDPSGYQTKSARNEVALYLAESKQPASGTTLMVRFEGTNIQDADLYYVPVGAWPAVAPIKVSFGDKKAGDELNKFSNLDQRSVGGSPDSYVQGAHKTSSDYITFTYTGAFPNAVMKSTPLFIWWAENIKLKDGTTIGKMQLNTSGLAVDASSTSGHELYNVLDTPKVPWYDTPLNTDPWVIALRDVTNPNAALAQTTLPDAGRKIAIYLFGWKTFTYDTVFGAPAYVSLVNPVPIELVDYIKMAHPTVNCYDQAAGVVAYFNLVGANAAFKYKDPYGFINADPIVGIGTCNNPFPNGAPLVVDPNDITRSKFGNHAYGVYGGKVFDACAGPEVGTRTEKQYWAFAVDVTACLVWQTAHPGLPPIFDLTTLSTKFGVIIQQ
jgi:hypothetical protein